MTMLPKRILLVILLELCAPEFSKSLGISFDKVDRSIAQPEQIESVSSRNGEGASTSSLNAKILQDESALPSISVSNTSDVSIPATRGKRQDGSISARTINFNGAGPLGPGTGPLCFEREVEGTCRYRTAPDECFRHEWTAYATIVNIGYKKIISVPEGLEVYPGGHPRVRVFLKSSCCNPIVQFIALDLFLQSNVCLVDVRELQDLHPGEIVGIVLGVLLFFIVVIAIILLCVRRQRMKKLEKNTVIFGRSLTRSKSRSEIPNHS